MSLEYGPMPLTFKIPLSYYLDIDLLTVLFQYCSYLPVGSCE